MKTTRSQHSHHAIVDLKRLVHKTVIVYNLVSYIVVKQQHQKLQITTPFYRLNTGCINIKIHSDTKARKRQLNYLIFFMEE